MSRSLDLIRADLAEASAAADRLETSLAPLRLDLLRQAILDLDKKLKKVRTREERILYPVLLDRSPLIAVVIGALVREHETEREAVASARSFLQVSSGDTVNLVPLVEVCRQLVRTVRELHRKKEQMIHKDAAALLGPAEDAELAERMAQQSPEDTRLLPRS